MTVRKSDIYISPKDCLEGDLRGDGFSIPTAEGKKFTWLVLILGARSQPCMKMY
ncbi:hypothetical protein NC996_03225 [Trichocoleus sp. ST-U2]|uniref:hypothetical protein n=1 Tax=Coleofasciculus sp. FACHB-SPT9 TaxID=2692791 RepID=UPI001684DBB0|nr:hypothetical protein [Coleofasciculus sp. FACHB-SPT9]MBD1887856.1 hypothetical protein [Coleofasciculus sp. FACHB-SPT9]